MKLHSIITLLLFSSLLIACDNDLPYAPDADTEGHTAASTATIAANKAVLDQLDFTDRQDFEDARRGLIARSTFFYLRSRSR